MIRRTLIILSAAALVVTGAAAASAYTVDDAGHGFVGKGEVQLALGWNNKALQTNAGQVDFFYASETVTEVSWICTNANNEKTQPRSRTTTATVQGLLDAAARDGKQQITGFFLNGFDGVVVTSDPVTAGDPLNSCPSGPWSLTTPAGEPELVSSTGGLYVKANGTAVLLPATAVVTTVN
ncbi:MAG: hypothetical protein H5T83_09410 [Actinotalea sp.]|nr:hypothetical protein [Actinotalea sp.]